MLSMPILLDFECPLWYTTYFCHATLTAESGVDCGTFVAPTGANTPDDISGLLGHAA